MNLSGRHWNNLEDRLVKRFKEREDLLVEALLSDGPPYGTEELTGRDLYDHLISLRASGDGAYWNDQTAQSALAKLEELYGPAPALQPPFSAPTAGVLV